jgi:glyoxylase-like metal-dependent hydrolase (beta-lactamase superfamily II)
MSLDFDVFVVDPKPIPSAVPGFEEAVGPATWPPSTSTLISDDGGALLVDCLITEQEGRELAAWVKSHDCEPGYVYITHPHADHFLGLPGSWRRSRKPGRSPWPSPFPRWKSRSRRGTCRSGAGSFPAS